MSETVLDPEDITTEHLLNTFSWRYIGLFYGLFHEGILVYFMGFQIKYVI